MKKPTKALNKGSGSFLEKTEDIKGSKTRITISSAAIAVTVVLIVSLIVVNGLQTAAEAASMAFQASKESVSDEVYQDIYDISFTKAEAQHHTKNQATVSLGNIREIQKLEVLTVNEVSYQVTENPDKGILDTLTQFVKGKSVSWLEVPAKGDFTVNLKTSEFIVDPRHNHIIARIPKPELTNFTIDYKNVVQLEFESGGVFQNSAKIGVDLAMQQLQDAELSMMREIYNKQDYYQRAMASAEKILINLVKQLNPDIPDLKVDVKFYE